MVVVVVGWLALSSFGELVSFMVNFPGREELKVCNCYDISSSSVPLVAFFIRNVECNEAGLEIL